MGSIQRIIARLGGFLSDRNLIIRSTLFPNGFRDRKLLAGTGSVPTAMSQCHVFRYHLHQPHVTLGKVADIRRASRTAPQVVDTPYASQAFVASHTPDGSEWFGTWTYWK